MTGALTIADAVVVVVAFVAAFKIRFPHLSPFNWSHPHRAAHLVLAAFGLVGWLIVLRLAGLYEPERVKRTTRVLGRLLPAALVVGLTIAAALFLVQAKLVSRLVLVAFVAISTILLGTNRWVARRLVRWWGSKGGWQVLVVGTGRDAAELAHRLASEPELGARLVGHLALEGESGQPAVPPDSIRGELDDLEGLLDQHVVDQVAVASSVATPAQLDAIAMSCREVGIDVVIVASEMTALLARAAVDTLGEVPVLRLHGSPQYRATMVSKRVFDVCVAALLIAVTAPVMLVVATLVKATSRGPIFYVQERVGLNGRRFNLIKFRSMVADADRLRPTLQADNQADGPPFKMDRDPRVTKLGRWLRRFSIDEMPQLFNVLKGEMSLVGPRPPLPDEVARYDRWQRRRLSVRPGLTGVWQVSGRSDLDFETWMALDLGYIDDWSPWLDLKIMAKTIPAVISGRGAR